MAYGAIDLWATPRTHNVVSEGNEPIKDGIRPSNRLFERPLFEAHKQ